MWRVLKHKGFSVFLATFAVVLLSGVALAQVGMLSEDPAPDAGLAAAGAGDVTDWVGDGMADDLPEDDPPADQPKDDKPPAEEPKDEEPKDEEPKAEEPKDDEPPAEEPKDEEPKAEEPKDDEPPAEEPKEPPAEEPKDDSILLKITSPANGAEFEKKVAKIQGVTDPDAVVTVGKYEADTDGKGNWVIHLTLHSEKNVFEFRAQDEAGNVAEAAITIYFVGEHEEPDYKFSAHQKWDASDDTPPYNKYWGTAKPGATIWIVSDYGETRTTANDKGTWEAKVFFEGAPHATKFKVVVESSDGGRAQFYMKVYSPDHGEEHEFTANQKYGSCGEEVPYDKFWGTATPGATIWVESDFGGGVTTANEKGEWFIKVFFPEAPFGEPFTVYVESNDGGFAEFTFVRTGGEHA